MCHAVCTVLLLHLHHFRPKPLSCLWSNKHSQKLSTLCHLSWSVLRKLKVYLEGTGKTSADEKDNTDPCRPFQKNFKGNGNLTTAQKKKKSSGLRDCLWIQMESSRVNCHHHPAGGSSNKGSSFKHSSNKLILKVAWWDGFADTFYGGPWLPVLLATNIDGGSVILPMICSLVFTVFSHHLRNLYHVAYALKRPSSVVIQELLHPYTLRVDSGRKMRPQLMAVGPSRLNGHFDRLTCLGRRWSCSNQPGFHAKTKFWAEVFLRIFVRPAN